MLQFVLGFYLLPSWSGYIKKHLVQKLSVSCYLRRLVTNASEDFSSEYQSFNLMEAVPKKDLMIVLFNVWVNCLLKTGLQDKCFWRCRVSLVKFSYWSNFHVSIITGSRVMTIFLYIVFTRDPETGNTPVWVCPISGEWVELEISHLAQISLMKCYWILQNARVIAFTIFELLREMQLGEGRG